MSNSIAARDNGDTYQAMVFWIYALQMLGGSDIEMLGYEYDEVKSFDDIVVFYKKEQRFRDTYIIKDYIQVKFHMMQTGEFTMDNLLEPEFINADRNSFLQQVVNAYRNKKIDFSKSRFIIYSPWRIKSDDILNELIYNTDKSFNLKKMQEGKTERTRMGALRSKLCEKLSVNEEELYIILKQICIKDGQDSYEDLKKRLNEGFTYHKLQPWSGGRDTFPYCDMVRAWNRRGIRLFTADKIKCYCKKEGLFMASKDTANIAVKSFNRHEAWMNSWANHILDLTDKLAGRELQPRYSWSDIFHSIEQFVITNLDNAKEYHIAIETMLSVSFTVGRILNSKSALKVAPVQKTMDGFIDWGLDADNVSQYSKFIVSCQEMCGEAADMAISIGVTHDINEDVRDFIKNSGLKIGLYKNFVLEDFGMDSVKNGNHAWELAKQINREINRRSGNLKKGTLHIFIAGPNSLMFYLGMQSMMYGKIQIYEFDQNREKTYYPTIAFPQEGEAI